jgi:hypothetical protein
MAKRMRQYEYGDIVWAHFKQTDNPRWLEVRVLGKSDNGYNVWAFKNPYPLGFLVAEQDICYDSPF